MNHGQTNLLLVNKVFTPYKTMDRMPIQGFVPVHYVNGLPWTLLVTIDTNRGDDHGPSQTRAQRAHIAATIMIP